MPPVTPKGMITTAVSGCGNHQLLLGDAWKAVVALQLLPSIEVVVVDRDHGIAVIRQRKEEKKEVEKELEKEVMRSNSICGLNKRLSDKWVAHLGTNPIGMLNWEHLYHYREELLPLISLGDFYDLWLPGK
jgi:hypothetical protein